MRRSTLSKLAPDNDVDEVPETEKSLARALMVSTYGPRTSAWLLWGHRRQLRAQGVVDFVVPERPNKVIAEKLRWFFVAMEFLRKRPSWTVDVRAQKGKRTFRVRWLGWGSWGAERTAKSS